MKADLEVIDMIKPFPAEDIVLAADKPGPKIVVACCARSGSKYIKELLRRLKKDVGHERILPDGIVSWMIVHPRQIEQIKAVFEKDTTYIHLVRNPVKVIQSCSRLHVSEGRIGYEPFVEFFPEYKDLSPYEIGAYYWIEWNKRIQKEFNIDYILRVEDMQQPKQILEFAKWFNLDLNNLVVWVDKLGTNIHTHPWKEAVDIELNGLFSMEKLLKVNPVAYHDLKRNALEYGYQI